MNNWKYVIFKYFLNDALQPDSLPTDNYFALKYDFIETFQEGLVTNGSYKFFEILIAKFHSILF